MAAFKDSGLATLLGSPTHGGAGEPWSTACGVVRAIASHRWAARSLAQHYLWNWATLHSGTPRQAEALGAAATRGQWWFAGPAGRTGRRLRVRTDGQHVVFNGRQLCITGSSAADVAVLDGMLDDRADSPQAYRGTRLWAVVPAHHAGLTFHNDADDHEPGPDTAVTRRSTGRNNLCVAEMHVAHADVLRVPAFRFPPGPRQETGYLLRLLFGGVSGHETPAAAPPRESGGGAR